jgi:hypothetical protein
MNEPVPMSFFGMFVNQCAEQFCRDKSGLELWLNMMNEYPLLTMFEIKDIHSPYYTGFICASTAYLFFMFGYILTRKVIDDEL